MRIAAFIIVVCLLSACASKEVLNIGDLEPGKLPPPTVTVAIPGLGPCTDSPDRRVRFDSTQPINILVHGCYGSSGQFRALAQVLAFHGQQSACFTYDDRAKLAQSAAELRLAITQLGAQSQVRDVTVIGHSQGALIARAALTQAPIAYTPIDLRLVTISGPFSGIEAARTCGQKWLYPLTLGLLPASCYVATGAKWEDITYSSRFILEPGSLAPEVLSYLKIDTDERDRCRRQENGRCLESDEIFTLAEQRNMLVETDTRAKRVEVRAGHVEIVGNKREAPTKLIAILQDQGVLRTTAPNRASAFNTLLSRIYHSEATSR